MDRLVIMLALLLAPLASVQAYPIPPTGPVRIERTPSAQPVWAQPPERFQAEQAAVVHQLVASLPRAAAIPASRSPFHFGASGLYPNRYFVPRFGITPWYPDLPPR
jgi:hypothetical protein